MMARVTVPHRRRPSMLPLAAACAVVAGAVVAGVLGTVAFKSANSFTRDGAAALLAGVAAWMFVSDRYELTLSVFALYLGLLDGFLKLKTGSSVATLGRDVLLYSIAGGAVVRLALSHRRVRLPKLTLAGVVWVVLCVVEVLNPVVPSITHAFAGTRQHIEFVPLFFLGYLVMRSERRLTGFLVIVVVIAGANGIVALIQSRMSVAELASWGPGYANQVYGTAARTFYTSSGAVAIRPAGLGGDFGFGGAVGMLALPALLALGVKWGRSWRGVAVAVVGAPVVILAIVTSQSRSAVVASVVAGVAFLFLTARTKKGAQTIATAAILGAAAYFLLPVFFPAAASQSNRYASIAPTKVLSTAVNYRSGTLSLVPEYMVKYPLGDGIGENGPAAGSAVGGTQASGNNAESEFNFLVLEVGIPGLLLLTGLMVAVLGYGFQLRRTPDAELQRALMVLLAGNAGIAAWWFVGVTTAASPWSPFFWFTAGAIVYWWERAAAARRAPMRATVADAPDVGLRWRREKAAPVPAQRGWSASPGRTRPELLPEPAGRAPLVSEAPPAVLTPTTETFAGAAAIRGDAVLTDAEIARSASRGAVASVTRGVVVMALQAAGSLLVARLVVPGSYGIWGLALTVVGAVRYVGDLGVTYRLEVLRTLSDRDLSRGLGVGLATAVCGGVIASAIWQVLPLVAHGPAGARLIVPVLALALVATVPAGPASAKLARRLAFRTGATAGLLSTLVLFVIEIPLLVAGLGIWALLTAYVAATAFQTAYLVVAARGVPLPSLRGPILRMIRQSIPYQAPLLAQAVVGLIVSALVASLLGAKGVGYFAWSTILATPVLTVVFTLEGVVAPSLARMLRDDGRAFGQATETVLLTFATLAAAAAAASVGLVVPIVHYVFGTRWAPAAGAVQFALVGVVPMSLVAACAAIVNSQDKPGRRLRASIAAGVTALVLTVPLIVAGGVTGAGAVAYVLAPIVEVSVLAAGAQARLGHLVLRVGRIAFPLAALSFVLGHVSNSPLALALSLVAMGATAVAILCAAEHDLVRVLWRQVSTRREARVPG
jgi:lipopolysaccharide exporter